MDIQVGAVAPDFSLRAHIQEQAIALSQYRGRPVVVAFFTVCLYRWLNQSSQRVPCELRRFSST